MGLRNGTRHLSLSEGITGAGLTGSHASGVSSAQASQPVACTHRKTHALSYSIEMDEPPLVKTAANLFRSYCYQYRESRVAGILCAGWDKREGGQVRVCVCVGGGGGGGGLWCRYEACSLA